jgi:sulfide:quinone oxidoreductase
MAGKTIVVLGGGVGGLVAANALRRRLNPEHRVILVEKNTHHAFPPSFVWVLFGERSASQATRPLSQLVRRGVEVVHAEAVQLDRARRRIETTGPALAYDYLVVALGAELAPETIPGLAQAGDTFYHLDGAAKLAQAIQAFGGGTIAIVVARTPFKCPSAPHEVALLLDHLFRKKGIRERVDLHLFTPEPLPMPTAGPVMGNMLKQMDENHGITVHLRHRLTSVDSAQRELVFEGGQKARFDLLVSVPPHRSPRLVQAAGLTGESGWIPVEARTLKTRFEGVWAIGDITSISLLGRHQPDVPLTLPKAGTFAHIQGAVVADQIAATIDGSTSASAFDGKGYCWIEMEQGLAAFASGEFYVERAPIVNLKPPSRTLYWGKVLFEKYWLSSGWTRNLWQTLLTLGGRGMGIEVRL